jgi:acyl-CoA dehydrogenase
VSEYRYLDWPFFEERHRDLARGLRRFLTLEFPSASPGTTVEARCRQLVKVLGAHGWLRHLVPGDFGGAASTLDARTLCLLRECLAEHDGLADFVCAMQGLGSGAITLAGDEIQKKRYLPRVAEGSLIAAFALSEPDAGSDVAALATTAQRVGNDYLIEGEKTWISNGGIADFYTVFARLPGSTGTQGICAFVVEADARGLEIAERLEVIAPHPLATLRFQGCRVAATQRLGAEGEGFKLAMRTLDIFRVSVAAAAVGFARRALRESLTHCRTRRLFGQALADFQLTQAALATMATEIDAAALLTYRAAWLRDVAGASITREAAMAKMTATESAQRCIDRAVQLFGGRGVQKGQIVESLYREIRALRIYEGATEVQQLIIGRDLLRNGI